MSKLSVDSGDRLLLAITTLIGVSLVVAGSWKAWSWIGHGHLPGEDLSTQARTADDAVGQPRDANGQSESPVNAEKHHSSKDHEHRHHHHHHRHAKSLGSNSRDRRTLHDNDGLVEAGKLSQSRSRTEPRFPGNDQARGSMEDDMNSSHILAFHETHDEPVQMSHSDGQSEETLDARQKRHRSSGLSGNRNDSRSGQHQGSSLSIDQSGGSSASADELSRLLQRSIDDYLAKHPPFEDLESEKTLLRPGPEPGSEPPGRKFRTLAQQEARSRKIAFEESKRAFKSGQKAEAKRLSDLGKYHDENAKRYNALAAEEIFAYNNPPRRSSYCDLHGLHVEEALHYAKNHLVRCRASGTDKTMIIVGQGLHSQYGGARIKPAIMAMLAEGGGIVAGVHEKNEGCIVVEFAVRRK